MGELGTARVGERREAAPAAGLVDALPLIALGLWVANDHVLKAAWPGPVTGILSDFAGLLVVPLAVQAAWELLEWAARRWRGPSTVALAAAILAVGVAFAAVQLWSPATEAYRWGMGLAQWPVRALWSLGAGASVPSVAPVVAVGDAGDLLALPALALTWWAGRRRVARAARDLPPRPG